jgi:type I restriction enzyme S subunit
MKNMKPYPAYKNSGVEWIGEIPKAWEVKRLKYLDKCVMGQSPASDDCNETGLGIPFLQGNADFEELHPFPSVWCEHPNKLAESGDILLSVRAPVGAVNIADRVYGIGRGLCAIRTKQSHKSYLYFRTLCILEELNSIATGSTYTAVSVEQVSNVLLPHPPFDEQKTIAEYLDCKTAQIDELLTFH